MIDETEERLLREELELIQQQRDVLAIAIAETTEMLGHEGCDAVDLRDAIGQLKRLLNGKDLDDELEGLAARIQVLVKRSGR